MLMSLATTKFKHQNHIVSCTLRAKFAICDYLVSFSCQ